MSRNHNSLRIGQPAPGPHTHGAQARPDAMIPAAGRARPATAARPTAEAAVVDSVRSTAVAAIEVNEAPYRDLVAGRPARPAVDGGSRHAPALPMARISQRGRSPMQSGRARESNWSLTFEPQHRKKIDFLMGWTGSRDTLQQVELRFSTLDAAVAFAERSRLDYVVETPRPREFRPKSYADNFRHDRPLP